MSAVKAVRSRVCDYMGGMYIVENILLSFCFDAGACLMSAHFARRFI
jgi:hypothetical protein